MHADYVAEAAEALVKGSWMVRPEGEFTPQGASPFALFIGPQAEERAKDYAAGLERGRLRLVPGGRPTLSSPAVPVLEVPKAQGTT